MDFRRIKSVHWFLEVGCYTCQNGKTGSNIVWFLAGQRNEKCEIVFF